MNIFYIFFISSVAAIGGFLFGFDSGVINGTVDALRGSFGSSDFGTGFSVASMLLGCAVGAYVIGIFADRLGRKPSMMIAALMFLLSAWGSGVADTSFEFVIYRLIGGFAVGAASVLAPAYISEVSPKEYRGRFASLQQLAIVLGIFAAFLSNFLIAEIFGSAANVGWLGYEAWRWMYWMEAIPASLFFLLCLFIPESPRFLVAKNKESTAKLVLQKSMGNYAETLIVEIKQSLSNYRTPKLKDLYEANKGRIYPMLWVGIALSVFQQFVGINVVFYYGSVLWQAAGFSESDALLVNVISGTINVLSTFVAIALIDKIGRKPLLFFGGIGMTISLLGLSVIFAMAGTDASGKLVLSSENGTLALILANTFVFSFGASWGPVVWVLLGEIFNNRMRAMALSISAAAQWLANFAITLSFPVMLSKFGLGPAYAFYTLSAALAVIFVLRWVP
ncbi:sugar porter family MFS transporter [bacterium]|nr:sugar porter family MFS transporter [bacterium]